VKPERLLHAAALFHGHLGPWLALGLRAGDFAARALDADPFHLRARVFCPGRTPYTCFIDGVQAGSGCTMGKGNIRHVRSRAVRGEFERFSAQGALPWRAGADAGVRLELRPEVWTELHLSPARTIADVEKTARRVFTRPAEKLFFIA